MMRGGLEQLRFVEQRKGRAFSEISVRDINPDLYEGAYALLEFAVSQGLLPDVSVQGRGSRWENYMFFEDDNSIGSHISTVKLNATRESVGPKRVTTIALEASNFLYPSGLFESGQPCRSRTILELSASKFFLFGDTLSRNREFGTVTTGLELGLLDKNFYLMGARLYFSFGGMDESVLNFSFGSDSCRGVPVGELSDKVTSSKLGEHGLKVCFADGKLTPFGSKLLDEYGLGKSFPYRLRLGGLQKIMQSLANGGVDGQSREEVIRVIRDMGTVDPEALKMAVLDKSV